MNPKTAASFLAVDVGNSSVRLALFDGDTGEAFPRPAALFAMDAAFGSLDALEAWHSANAPPAVPWYVASVHARASRRLEQWLAQRQAGGAVHRVTHEHLPLAVEAEFPERVGIDRLLAAVAVNRLRDPHRPAIVVDAGTAITVDCISAGGAFLGGAILPGMRMAAQALDRYTERLPLVDVSSLDRPAPVGRNTQAAIESGIYWGVRGAVLQLIAEISRCLSASPQLFITGGDAARLHLDGLQIVPHLVLSGIALAALATPVAPVCQEDAKP